MGRALKRRVVQEGEPWKKPCKNYPSPEERD